MALALTARMVIKTCQKIGRIKLFEVRLWPKAEVTSGTDFAELNGRFPTNSSPPEIRSDCLLQLDN